MLTYKPAKANPDGTTSVKIISTITPSSLWPARKKLDSYTPFSKEEVTEVATDQSTFLPRSWGEED